MTRTHTHMARTWLLAGGVLTLAAAHALAQPLGAAPKISLKRVAANHAIVEVARRAGPHPQGSDRPAVHRDDYDKRR